MMKTRILQFVGTFLGLFMLLQVHGQPLYRSGLGKVGQASFYKIPLSPEIVAKSGNDLADIRILNEKDQQVPYILKREDAASSYNKSFIELPILSAGKERDKLTHVIIQNAGNMILDQLVLEIKNADAARKLTLSGSDDNKNWFVIKEDILLEGLYRKNDFRVLQAIQFPYSSYNYFKISFDEENRLPLNIIRAGFYARTLTDGSYQPVPTAVVTQVNGDDKISYVTARFNSDYLINKIGIQADGPRFFSRSVTLYKNLHEKKQLLGSYMLRSDDPLFYPVNARTNEILIEIQNQDNPPLTVTAVNAYQLYIYIVAWLEPAYQYSLVVGDSLASAPGYDLAAFSDSIGKVIQILSPGPLQENDQFRSVKSASGNGKLILWAAIGIVLLVLLFLTLRMTKKVSSREV